MNSRLLQSVRRCASRSPGLTRLTAVWNQEERVRGRRPSVGDATEGDVLSIVSRIQKSVAGGSVRRDWA